MPHYSVEKNRCIYNCKKTQNDSPSRLYSVNIKHDRSSTLEITEEIELNPIEDSVEIPTWQKKIVSKSYSLTSLSDFTVIVAPFSFCTSDPPPELFNNLTLSKTISPPIDSLNIPFPLS